MTKADVIASLKREPVEFHGLWLRPWSMAQRLEFAAWVEANPGKDGLAEKLFVMSVCDRDGNLLFTDADLSTVADLFGAPVQRVALRVQELNGDADPGKAS